MSAKLVLTVKDSSRMAKDYSMSMMDKMFHPLKHNKILNSKAKIGILIDDEDILRGKILMPKQYKK